MPSTRRTCHLLVLTVAVAGLTVAGCSAETTETKVPASPAADAAAPAATPAGDGKVALSPGGVTTKIDVPAQSTEEQYAQACMSAKDWMTAKGGDPDTLVEPFLNEVQSAAEAGPGAFGKTWPQLSEAEQAAVIIAVRAAADGGC